MDHQDTARAVGNTVVAMTSAVATIVLPAWIQIVPFFLSMVTSILGIVWWVVKINNERRKRKESDHE